MAKIAGNQPFNLSGRVGGFVYRQTRDGVVVAQRPGTKLQKARGKKTSKAQAAQQTRFRLANKYAQHVLADPLARRAYERLGKERERRFDRLVAGDYLNPPEIEHIELGSYRGRSGDLIRVLAFDDVEVVSLEVEIRTIAGAPVEQGFATKKQGVWDYAATVNAPADDHLIISVTAQDRPNNRTTAKVVYP